MSDRRAQRAARGHRRAEMATGDVPACLSVGRLVEVWADPDLPGSTISAYVRYSRARNGWIAGSRARERAIWRIFSAPWKAADDTDRLASAGITRADLPGLAAEATDLFNRATQGAKR